MAASVANTATDKYSSQSAASELQQPGFAVQEPAQCEGRAVGQPPREYWAPGQWTEPGCHARAATTSAAQQRRDTGTASSNGATRLSMTALNARVDGGAKGAARVEPRDQAAHRQYQREQHQQ